MAFILRNAYVTLDGTDVSSLVESVEVAMVYADVPVTAMGAFGEQHLPGLRNDKFTLNAFSSFGASSLDAAVQTKFAAGGTIAVIVMAAGSTVGTLNPRYTGFAPLLTYTPVGGKVGDAAMTPLELPCNGTIGVATT